MAHTLINAVTAGEDRHRGSPMVCRDVARVIIIRNSNIVCSRRKRCLLRCLCSWRGGGERGGEKEQEQQKIGAACKEDTTEGPADVSFLLFY